MNVNLSGKWPRLSSPKKYIFSSLSSSVTSPRCALKQNFLFRTWASVINKSWNSTSVLDPKWASKVKFSCFSFITIAKKYSCNVYRNYIVKLITHLQSHFSRPHSQRLQISLNSVNSDKPVLSRSPMNFERGRWVQVNLSLEVHLSCLRWRQRKRRIISIVFRLETILKVSKGGGKKKDILLVFMRPREGLSQNLLR